MHSSIIGAFLGYLVGAGVWFISGRLSARYQAEPVSVVSDQGADPAQPPPEATGGLPSTQIGGLPSTRIGGLISPWALVMQAGFAVLGAYAWWKAAGPAQGIAALVLTGLLMSISLVDLRVRRIPNILCAALVLWALVQMFWLGQPKPVAAVVGMLAAGVLFLIVALVGRGAMGAGDIKLVAALGAVLGFPLIFPALACGIIAGGLAALVLIVTRRVGRKGFMAYGPYLALGSWVIWMGTMGLWP